MNISLTHGQLVKTLTQASNLVAIDTIVWHNAIHTNTYTTHANLRLTVNIHFSTKQNRPSITFITQCCTS